jgi:hypothetical protein
VDNKISIYQYIASNDPYSAKSICNKYGYSLKDVQTANDLAVCLEQLVAVEGEAAFKDIVALHPDKDLIVDLYGTQVQAASAQKADGSCKGCSKKSDSTVQAYLQAAQQNSGHSLQQGNTFLFAGVLILAVALIATAKS